MAIPVKAARYTSPESSDAQDAMLLRANSRTTNSHSATGTQRTTARERNSAMPEHDQPQHGPQQTHRHEQLRRAGLHPGQRVAHGLAVGGVGGQGEVREADAAEDAVAETAEDAEHATEPRGARCAGVSEGRDRNDGDEEGQLGERERQGGDTSPTFRPRRSAPAVGQGRR